MLYTALAHSDEWDYNDVMCTNLQLSLALTLVMKS